MSIRTGNGQQSACDMDALIQQFKALQIRVITPDKNVLLSPGSLQFIGDVDSELPGDMDEQFLSNFGKLPYLDLTFKNMLPEMVNKLLLHVNGNLEALSLESEERQGFDEARFDFELLKRFKLNSLSVKTDIRPREVQDLCSVLSPQTQTLSIGNSSESYAFRIDFSKLQDIALKHLILYNFDLLPKSVDSLFANLNPNTKRLTLKEFFVEGLGTEWEDPEPLNTQPHHYVRKSPLEEITFDSCCIKDSEVGALMDKMTNTIKCLNITGDTSGLTRKGLGIMLDRVKAGTQLEQLQLPRNLENTDEVKSIRAIVCKKGLWEKFSRIDVMKQNNIFPAGGSMSIRTGNGQQSACKLPGVDEQRFSEFGKLPDLGLIFTDILPEIINKWLPLPLSRNLENTDEAKLRQDLIKPQRKYDVEVSQPSEVLEVNESTTDKEVTLLSSRDNDSPAVRYVSHTRNDNDTKLEQNLIAPQREPYNVEASQLSEVLEISKSAPDKKVSLSSSEDDEVLSSSSEDKEVTLLSSGNDDRPAVRYVSHIREEIEVDDSKITLSNMLESSVLQKAIIVRKPKDLAHKETLRRKLSHFEKITKGLNDELALEGHNTPFPIMKKFMLVSNVIVSGMLMRFLIENDSGAKKSPDQLLKTLTGINNMGAIQKKMRQISMGKTLNLDKIRGFQPRWREALEGLNKMDAINVPSIIDICEIMAMAIQSESAREFLREFNCVNEPNITRASFVAFSNERIDGLGGFQKQPLEMKEVISRIKNMLSWCADDLARSIEAYIDRASELRNGLTKMLAQKTVANKVAINMSFEKGFWEECSYAEHLIRDILDRTDVEDYKFLLKEAYLSKMKDFMLVNRGVASRMLVLFLTENDSGANKNRDQLLKTLNDMDEMGSILDKWKQVLMDKGLKLDKMRGLQPRWKEALEQFNKVNAMRIRVLSGIDIGEIIAIQSEFAKGFLRELGCINNLDITWGLFMATPIRRADGSGVFQKQLRETKEVIRRIKDAPSWCVNDLAKSIEKYINRARALRKLWIEDSEGISNARTVRFAVMTKSIGLVEKGCNQAARMQTPLIETLRVLRKRIYSISKKKTEVGKANHEALILLQNCLECDLKDMAKHMAIQSQLVKNLKNRLTYIENTSASLLQSMRDSTVNVDKWIDKLTDVHDGWDKHSVEKTKVPSQKVSTILQLLQKVSRHLSERKKTKQKLIENLETNVNACLDQAIKPPCKLMELFCNIRDGSSDFFKKEILRPAQTHLGKAVIAQWALVNYLENIREVQAVGYLLAKREPRFERQYAYRAMFKIVNPEFKPISVMLKEAGRGGLIAMFHKLCELERLLLAGPNESYFPESLFNQIMLYHGCDDYYACEARHVYRSISGAAFGQAAQQVLPGNKVPDVLSDELALLKRGHLSSRGEIASSILVFSYKRILAQKKRNTVHDERDTKCVKLGK